MINKQSYQITGMRQDNLVGTGFSSKFAHEIMNMRLNTIGDYTTTAWTTEKGTLAKTVKWEEDTDRKAVALINNNSRYNIIPIGQCVINDQWIVFATQSLDENTIRGIDIIFRYKYEQGTDTLLGTLLYVGHLNFDAKHPCETLPYYENDNIQKVYWLDGKNQPRVINIANVKEHINLDSQFDFVQELSLKEKVTITKNNSGAGLFPPGTVKYVLTYYKKYGQESNIVYDSPLYYPIKGERGCSPDELSGDTFEIRVDNIDDTHGFDYIRLYSIVRTSENATPIVRIVADKEIDSLPVIATNPNRPKYALFVDTNTTGEIVDSTILQFLGSKEICAETFDQKDNTLFLGNITLIQKSAQEVLKNIPLDDNSARFVLGTTDFFANEVYPSKGYNYLYRSAGAFASENAKIIGIRTNNNGTDRNFYQYTNQMNATECWNNYIDPNDPSTGIVRKYNGNSQKIKIFKYKEWYRFGIQFQNTKGNWSEVIPIRYNDNQTIKYETENTIKPKTDDWASVGIFGVFKYQLPSTAVEALLNNNYVKARLVCCYPTNADRTVLMQGVINPTIYNKFWQESNSPDYFASWFFRPNDIGDNDNFSNINSIPYRHNKPLAWVGRGNCEIQSICGRYESQTIVPNNKENFYISQDYLTLNSPEITYDESIRTLNLDSIKIKRIGSIPINSWSASVYVESGAMLPFADGSTGVGLKFPQDIFSFRLTNDPNVNINGSHYVHQGEWHDRQYYAFGFDSMPYPLYPFHRKGSLANYVGSFGSFDYDDDGNYYDIGEGSVLKSKVLSHLLYSANTKYNDLANDYYFNNNIQFPLKIVDTNEIMSTIINNKTYYGNLDSIAPVRDNNTTGNIEDYDGTIVLHSGRYLVVAWQNRLNNQINYMWDVAGLENDSGFLSSDPVPITFNSTPHGIFYSDFGSSDAWNTQSGVNIPYLHLVDVYRNVSNRFGGNAPIQSNMYLPCGPVIDLRECYDGITYYSPILLGIEGDHYYMRYDCLKTCSRSIEDTNQIVEILSFMCETRINLDGRYDGRRGQQNNTTVTNANFNLINNSYTQSNNFFIYNTLDKDDAKIDKFANQLTWTKPKTSGEDIDTWTNLTLANVADADGTIGFITKILNTNNNLYLFQSHGVSVIGYNEKTALSVENGVPLEIANSEKYTGLTYLTKQIGCQNKWSISNTKNEIFFIDDSRQEINAFGGEEGIISLSTANGFDAFMIQQLPDSEHFTPWTPYDTNNFVSYYDKLGNDVFFINKYYCLAWNEQSKTFTSFYSYNNVALMANVGTHLLMWENSNKLIFDIDTNTIDETIVSYQEITNTTYETIEHTVSLGTEDTTYSGEGLIATIYHGPNLTTTTTNNYLSVNNTLNTYCWEFAALENQIFVNTPDADTLRNSWGRLVTIPYSYCNNLNYEWNAHYIISLEFRKEGEPFIIQIEMQGKHKAFSYYDNVKHQWEMSNPVPIVRYRATPNVTQEDISRLKFFIGGYNQPTLNFGNIIYISGGYWKAPNDVQPWNNIDNNPFEVDIETTVNDVTTISKQEVYCVVKIYDLNQDSEHANYIGAIQTQGTPFRQNYINDDAAQFDSDHYQVETTITTSEVVEHTETTYEPIYITVQTTIGRIISSSQNIWAARELDEYCNFFNHREPYWITLVCDGQIVDKGHNINAFSSDKVFNNIEFRADTFNPNGINSTINEPVFTKKAAYNGYQMYKEFPIDATRKFNTWRIQLPRATYNINNTLTTTRDRIRNPFCYIKLLNDDVVPPYLTNRNRMILHDLDVSFDIR